MPQSTTVSSFDQRSREKFSNLVVLVFPSEFEVGLIAALLIKISTCNPKSIISFAVLQILDPEVDPQDTYECFHLEVFSEGFDR